MIAALTWHISRASGLVAWALVAVATIWGVLLASRLLERRPSPAWLLDLHRHLGALALVLTVVHVGAIWADDYVDYTVGELLVPFLSDEERVPVALGVVCLWLLVTIQVSSSPRVPLSLARWRRLHLLSAPLMVLVTLHGWLVGTDAGHAVVVILGLVLLSELVLITGLRVRHGRRPVPARVEQV